MLVGHRDRVRGDANMLTLTWMGDIKANSSISAQACTDWTSPPYVCAQTEEGDERIGVLISTEQDAVHYSLC